MLESKSPACRRFIMFAFGFQAPELPEFQRMESRELQKAERRAEETEGEVRAWRHAGIKHGKRKIS